MSAYETKAYVDHIELGSSQERDLTQVQADPAYVDDRAEDNRAEEAKGRNADKYGQKYWLSVSYIGTLFAIGAAFMGGIGGE